MKTKRILSFILCIVLLCSCASAYTLDAYNQVLADDTQQTDPELSKEDFASIYNEYAKTHYKDYYYNLFSQILDIYINNHLYSFTKQDVLETMIQNILIQDPSLFKYMVNQMLGTMDPYSSYHEKDSNFLNVDKGNKGFGITIIQKDDGPYIKTVLEDSAAKEIGLLAGDKIISVGPYIVDNLPQSVLMNILSSHYVFLSEKDAEGKYTDKNPPCPITVNRNGEILTFTLQKDEMTVPQITSYLLDDGKTAVVTIASFLGTDTDKLFNDLIFEYNKNGVENLTIDLRDNGGGSLEHALSMTETFLDKGEILCYYNDRKLQEPRPIYSETDKASFKSITVLVNQNTASAAELMTSILQTHGLAKVVGTVTYGKSLGQVVYTLPSSDFITITTYEILDINKQSYNGKGVIPDLVIDNVLLSYQLPKLEIFNHQNFVEIKPGVYSDVTLALEKRLNILGLLFESQVDGIFDENTQNTLKVFQKSYGLEDTGYVTYDTVTKITNLVNKYKVYDYYEDSQMDVALIIHRSFSQGKRLVNEKKALAKEHAEIIAKRDALIDEYLDSLEK